MSAPTGRGGGLRPLRQSLEVWTPGRGRAVDPLHAIATAWPAIVGPDVAANAAPLELSGPTLVVGTRSSAWSQQLQFLSLQILARLRELPSGATVERLAFRTGLAPRRRRRPTGDVAVARAPRRAGAAADGYVPAADVHEAFARLRARMRAIAAAPQLRCAACGAGLDGATTAEARQCAPCAGEAARVRRTNLERLVYMAPWLTLADLREHIPDLGAAEFEATRKVLLARWWLVLERARLAGRISPSGVERHVGSSYVLLQSRLPPDRLTPAIVRNLLGADLEKLLWPHAPADAGEER